jgi:hypothetical protein
MHIRKALAADFADQEDLAANFANQHELNMKKRRDRDFANIWREMLEADYRPKISRLQHNVISLIGCIIYCGEDVFALKKIIVCKDFFNRGAGAKQFQDVSYPDSLVPNTGSPTAFALFHCDPAETL